MNELPPRDSEPRPRSAADALRAFARHVQGLWGNRWWIPIVPTVYAVSMSIAGFYRWEYIVVAGSCLVCGFLSRGTKDFIVDVAPYVVFTITYDAVKYIIDATITPERVLTCGLRRLELSLFSVSPGVTPNDFFIAHHSVVADLFFAVPYAVFFIVVFAYGAYLFRVDRPRMRYFLWAFAIANFLAFICWVAIAAAPPWYVRAHGCTAVLSTPPSAAALLRVDSVIGIPYFESFYARASQVFGAVPSMHCAYPLLGLLTAWPFIHWRTRWIHVGYTVVMASAAVYLDHHWIIDTILGWLFALIAVFTARKIFEAFRWPLSAVVANQSVSNPGRERDPSSSAIGSPTSEVSEPSQADLAPSSNSAPR